MEIVQNFDTNIIVISCILQPPDNLTIVKNDSNPFKIRSQVCVNMHRLLYLKNKNVYTSFRHAIFLFNFA